MADNDAPPCAAHTMTHPRHRSMPFAPRFAALAGALASAGTRADTAAPPPLGPDFAAAPPPVDAGGLFNEAFFLKLGFSFMVGLAVGFALKLTFKVLLVLIGVILVALFALQYWDLVDVNWTGVEAHYDTGADWLSIQLSALLDFMGQNLSSGASFLAGLAVGLKI